MNLYKQINKVEKYIMENSSINKSDYYNPYPYNVGFPQRDVYTECLVDIANNALLRAQPKTQLGATSANCYVIKGSLKKEQPFDVLSRRFQSCFDNYHSHCQHDPHPSGGQQIYGKFADATRLAIKILERNQNGLETNLRNYQAFGIQGIALSTGIVAVGGILSSKSLIVAGAGAVAASVLGLFINDRRDQNTRKQDESDALAILLVLKNEKLIQ